MLSKLKVSLIVTTGLMVCSYIHHDFHDIFIFCFTASDLDDGVWMHTSTNSEVTWFGTKGISCNLSGEFKPLGGHALFIAFQKSAAHAWENGLYCDYDMTSEYVYICKALI